MKKRRLLSVLLAVILSLSLSVPSYAVEQTDALGQSEARGDQWAAEDFTYSADGTAITGLSESGTAKIAVNPEVVMPDAGPGGTAITSLADAGTNAGGMFGNGARVKSVVLPGQLQTIGNNVFRDCGLESISFPNTLKSIGNSAFMMDQLTEIILPDSVESVGAGAFASNFQVGEVKLSTGMTVIPQGFLSCSGQTAALNLTEIEIPEGITEIGNNAFAGNSFVKINVPGSVKKIGNYAFAQVQANKKLQEIVLHEGLEAIGSYAFRHALAKEIWIPSTVTSLSKNAFIDCSIKVYTYDQNLNISYFKSGVTEVVHISGNEVSEEDNTLMDEPAAEGDAKAVSKEAKYMAGAAKVETKEAVQAKEAAQTDNVWTSEDFVYTTITQTLNGCDYTRQFQITGPAIAGFSEAGEEKLKTNKDLVIPSVNAQGETLVGVAAKAFRDQGLESVTFPENMMVDYDDTVTHEVAQRGNFIIDTEAFSKNNLTSVTIPKGVIAIMSSAFRFNKIKTVSLPHTIWWIENSCFANNELRTVGFPKTCDFQVQIHAFAFAYNQIKSVRLPNYTEVVYKHAFVLNPGVEPCPENAPEKEKGLGGIVYMYTDNANLTKMERIHHMDRTAESQHSWHQKLIVGSKPAEEGEWETSDFTYDGTKITGLSESGIEKRKGNKILILPDKNADGQYITELADTSNSFGLFASAVDKFNSVELPARIERIGNRAFVENGLSGSVKFPATLKEIGLAAFQNNSLDSVILPDSLTVLGGGAFATNPKLTKIVLSKGLTEIANGAFGCSDAENWMEGLTELVIPEGITKIGNNAFAGNNIKDIKIPSTVKEIGEYAFSTKNYLKDECTVELSEGLTTIKTMAFRNKVIKEVELPTSVTSLDKDAFRKEYSDDTEAVTTTVYVSKDQYRDKQNFPASTYHTYSVKTDANDTEWDEFDFTYATCEEAGIRDDELTLYPAHETDKTIKLSPYVITGLSEQGQAKLAKNRDMVIPATDPEGNTITGIAPSAFYNGKSNPKVDYPIESVRFPDNVMTPYDGPEGILADGLTQRGNFIICSNAFLGNKLTELELPEGVISVGVNAFSQNELTSVKIPKTMWWIWKTSFAKNKIVSIDFPETCYFKLNIDSQAFAVNEIKAVSLPDRTEKLDRYAFLNNTGMEAVDASAPTIWKKSGVVYMYADPSVASEAFISHTGGSGLQLSYAQKLITDTPMPDEIKPWGEADFTYSADNKAITGLSEAGITKRGTNPNIIIPSKKADGTVITELSDAQAEGAGLFGSAEEKPTSIVLPENLEKIGNNVFRNCGLTKIRLPKTLNSIGDYAFAENNFEEIVLPDSVTEVGTGAFASNTALGKMKLSSQMTAVPASFMENSAVVAGFTELTIPNGITSIGDKAFKGNQLTGISFPETVKTIGSYAFAQSQESGVLADITLPNGLESIGSHAFQHATVTEFVLPSSVTALDNEAFRDCGGEGKVKLYTKNKAHVEQFNASEYHEVIYKHLMGTGWSEEDFIFDGTKVTGWSEQGNQTRLKNKELVIPDVNPEGAAITEVAGNAFKIPDSEVKQLKDSVESPNGMISIEIPDTVTRIGEKAFEYNSLEGVEFPKGLTEIGTSAFHGNRLKKAVIPDSVTTIAGGAFSENNITEIVLPKDLQKLEKGVFSMNIRLEQIDLPETLTEIDEMAFAGARLTSLIIPKSVTKIGRKAFHLHHLTELTVPGNVKEIGESAFEGTFKAITLKKLVLEEGIESIGSRAFKEGYLESVKIPNSLKSLASDAFENNSGKDNSHIVICYTDNEEHLNWPTADTYKIVLSDSEDPDKPDPDKPDPDKPDPDKPNPDKPDPDKPNPDKPNPDNPQKPVTVQKVTKIKITGTSSKIAAGKRITLKAVVTPSNAANKSVTWKSSNTKIATVNSKGVVTVKKNTGGRKVTITAIAKDGSGVKGTYKITSVKGTVKKITITGSRTSLKAGRSLKLKAKVTASKGAYKKIIWTSSNTKYAKVTASGKVRTYRTGKGKKVKIIAKAADGSGKKKTVTIKLK